MMEIGIWNWKDASWFDGWMHELVRMPDFCKEVNTSTFSHPA